MQHGGLASSGGGEMLPGDFEAAIRGQITAYVQATARPLLAFVDCARPSFPEWAARRGLGVSCLLCQRWY